MSGMNEIVDVVINYDLSNHMQRGLSYIMNRIIGHDDTLQININGQLWYKNRQTIKLEIEQRKLDSTAH